VNKTELATAIDEARWRDLVVSRTARISHRCVCANEFRPGWWVRVTSAGKWGDSVSETLRPTEEDVGTLAGEKREKYPDAKVETYQRPNPDYRPDCLGDIAPGDVYAEYVGESPPYQSGHPYCERCAVAVWGP
jgi:hypothetical protein